MVRKTIFFVFLVSFSGLLMVSLPFRGEAALDCLTIKTTSPEADKAYCKKELAKIEAELAKLLELQKEQQKQTGTLAGDVNYLTSQINALKTKVKARALAIAQLKVAITEKNTRIGSLNEKIKREYESIAQLLRNTNEFDNLTLVDLILSDQSISDFYSDLESYSSIKTAVKNSVDKIKGIKTETEEARKDLEDKQNAETDAKAELETAQQKVTQTEAEKRQLLTVSQQTEAAYKKLAAEKKARADRIRSALFNLAGTSQKIEFGTALEYANVVYKKLGVDPAFLLAILTQESNLGANVGQCYLTDPATGAGVGKNTGTPFANVMKPGRDVEPFLQITNDLGLNAYQTAVSCPIAGIAGYGGAMGPAQFIPSTWQLFAGRLRSILGHYASPWDPEDSFMASGMYLSDLGAIGTSQSAQNSAACRYYGSGGTSCFYAKSVQKLKITIQANIDLLE